MALRAGGGRLSTWWGLAVVAVLLAGCGAAPEFTYVTNSSDRTYVKVPRSWQPIDNKALEGAFGLDPAFSAADQGFWIAGYDADAAPSAAHLLGIDVVRGDRKRRNARQEVVEQDLRCQQRQEGQKQ